MPAMGIDVLERDSTTQTWTRRGGGGCSTSDKKKGGVVPQVIKEKGKGWVGKFFFSLL